MHRNRGERDRSIDRLLRRKEQHADLPATDACVDAETLAAWMDGSLSGESLDRAEHHAAGCARCQAMLASMARTAPETAARPSWRTVTVRWIVPVAAAAAAVMLWVFVDRGPGAPVSTVSRSVAADRQEGAPPAAQSAGPSQIAPLAPERAAKDAALPRRPSPAPDLLAERRSQPGRGGDGRAGQAQDALASSAASSRGSALSVAESFKTLPAAPPPVAPPAAPPIAASAPAPAEPKGLAETIAVAQSPDRAAGSARRGAVAFTTADILSPEPAFRWRLASPAAIQRSTDGGATWTPQVAPVAVLLTAGSSPARDICWMVGRDGAVVLSTDGATWHRRPFPEAVDLTAVRAIDSKAARVTTADGRQFSTADGGATWSRTP
jgi:hypothetical protein